MRSVFFCKIFLAATLVVIIFTILMSLFENDDIASIRQPVLNIPSDKPVEFNDNTIHNAKYWQNLDTSNGTFQLFNVYYDTRTIPYYGRPVLRINSFINRKNPTVKTSCRIFYKNLNETVISPVYEYQLMWRPEWGYNSHNKSFTPYLLACMNPLEDIPSSVSIVEDHTEKASNNLKVIYNPKSKADNAKKSFAVCVKDLDFMDDQTKQIVEWIEILSILGADKIFIYVIKIHPNLMRTLKYYEKIGKVQVEMITEPEGVPTRKESLLQWLQNEMTSLNDCLYKNMYVYDYILPLDIDEIFVPVKEEDRTWRELLIRMDSSSPQKDPTPAYVVHNVFFLLDNIHENEIQPEVPKDMMFLQHIYRAANFSKPGIGPKSFVNTKKVVTVHNHLPIMCLENKLCGRIYLEKSDVQLSHYRRDCENYPKDECEGFKKKTVRDVSLWRWKDDIIENVEKTLVELKNY